MIDTERKKMFGVGFDLDHTLALDHQLERTALERVFARMLPAAKHDVVRWGELIDTALQAYRSGKASLATALGDLFAEILGSPQIYEDVYTAVLPEVLSLAPSHVRAVEGARELIERLATAGIPTAILTNGWNPLQQRKATLIGYQGPVLVSDDLGIRKPNPQAFMALADALGLTPDQMLYVGDTPETDIVGALGVGMQAIWFDWEQRPYAENLPRPTHVIHALSELDALVFAAR